MFEQPDETHSEFRFLSRRTRDAITGIMLMGALVGELMLLYLAAKITWMLI